MEKLKLKTEMFVIGKKEKKIALLKEMRDSAFQDYKKETDANLKSMLLETCNEAHREYLTSLKEF